MEEEEEKKMHTGLEEKKTKTTCGGRVNGDWIFILQ